MPLVRNLSNEVTINMLQAASDARIAAIPEFEAIEMSVERKGPKGAPVLDADGVPEVVTKRVLKRKVQEQKEAAEMAEHRKAYPLLVEAPVPAGGFPTSKAETVRVEL